MHLPGFLTREASEGPQLPKERGSRGYAVPGGIFGCLAALFFWFVPIPVIAIVWLFDLTGPFADYMLMAIPFLLMLPIIGAVIGDNVRNAMRK